MRLLITGPNNCGKSAYAEAILSELEGPIGYFATLPNSEQHQHRIVRHEARRSSRWKVYEAHALPLLDLIHLGSLLRTQRAVLLDGLAFYVFRLLTSFPYQGSALRFEQFYQGLRDVLTVHPTPWIVVDLDWRYVVGVPPYDLADSVRWIHAILHEHCGARLVPLGSI